MINSKVEDAIHQGLLPDTTIISDISDVGLTEAQCRIVVMNRRWLAYCRKRLAELHAMKPKLLVCDCGHTAEQHAYWHGEMRHCDSIGCRCKKWRVSA